MKKAILIILSVLMLLSCNLDSGQGVFQQAFNATKKNYEMIQSVLGVINNNLIIQANKDLYSFDGNTITKIAEISSQEYFPIFVDDDKIYFVDQVNEEHAKFFYAEINNLKPSSGVPEEIISKNVVTPKIDRNEVENITNFSVTIHDLNTIQVCYSLDNDSTTNPDEKIKHYGLIDRNTISGNSFNISGTAEVPATARIMGIGALRVYQDDSELADGTEYLKNFESFMYRPSDSGDFTKIKIADGNKVDADEIPMGFDGDVMVDLQGNFYRISGNEKNIITGIDANDLIYRANNIMMVYYDAEKSLKLGYLYEEGIYVNDADKKDTNEKPAPYIIPITDDNDLLTACWIGKSGNKYLFATQENGFWIAELSDEKNDNNEYTCSIHQYNSGDEFDGPLSNYLSQSN